MSDYDYVIVGAGSAGCVLANRLSADGAEVLLVEAGGSDRSPKVKIPAAFAQLFRTNVDWDYSYGPEPGCDGRELFVPRGKMLGGSSSMNAMLYVRGHRDDYDGWRDDHGCEGWGWDDVLPYFIRSEHHETGPSATHGFGGPLNVAPPRSPRKLTDLIVGATRARGFDFQVDYNGGDPDGVSLVETTQRNGRRWSSVDAFLKPIKGRPNLEVASGVSALGLELDGDRVSGVRLAGKAPFATARARREVILAAGAIGSPQLLMLSGIGDRDKLAAVGIDAAVELPGVGSNLQDHPFCVGIWESAIGKSLADAEKPQAAAEWLLRRTGPLASTVAEAFLFTRSDGGDGPPDLQFHLAPAFFSDHGFEEFDGHAYTVGPVLVEPKARGEITLTSSDPAAKPRMIGNHLNDDGDIAAMVAGMKLAREIAATEPLASATAREIYPGPGVGSSDEEIAADVRRRTEMLYHPVGTCAMGAGADAVVDAELRVRGVDGLRVADASVMPVITRGNTNAPTYMIAEKAADMILGKDPLPAASAHAAAPA
ncbi:MAG: GMC family oxidoreductase N-terminal domain-containing protein [Solirubrobacterales bacterium]|nr:GMC family oxidoreductase N-terminal domain-containing protein [Thermoleophilales bacterium]MCO5327090.1 GMC family oxidoreductase N-terminal domain-containing protein [Solirubrobacterales bacterium]